MIAQLHAKAHSLNKKIVFPEGDDPRTIRAVHRLSKDGIVRPVVLGAAEKVRSLADAEGIALPHTIQIVDPATTEKTSDYAQTLFNLRKHKGLTYEKALEIATDPLYFGDLMVKRGEVDGCVAGATHPSPDVVRAAIHVLGVAPGSALVSSFFLMILPGGKVLTFADCGVNPDPDSEQLASIGIDAAANHKFLTGEEPRVAFLSFSTKGSAEHARVDKVQEAVQIARSQRPDIVMDGEFQFDAAFVPSVAKRKAPDSPIAGNANVFIFPDLDSGNIGYKITQRIGGAEAFGPILQGLNGAANDLSRGCDADDIVNVAAITAIQSAA
ncbi:MAG: phosphate acetyltransferase [Rubricoccaceae bacterium]|nr:phosphate acetyltransferase [Rubricoccaceae bacterium]